MKKPIFITSLLLILLMLFSCGGGGGGESGSDENIDIPNYLCFTANENNCQLTMQVNVSSYPHTCNPPILEYSTDGKKWKSFNSVSGEYEWPILERTGDKVYFRGDNSTFSFVDEKYSFKTFGSFKVSGNIMSLVDKSLKLKTIPCDYCFEDLFSGCDITSAPELPAVILSNNCYRSMFYSCHNLEKAPALPALTLAEYCYEGMFTDCTSLISAPKLPAVVLVEGCYMNMFLGCTSLTEAPELPSDNMVRNCYNAMFAGCTALTLAPSLPAMNLAENCYLGMFSNCTGLASAPILPATNLQNGCYSLMFYGCKRLKNITVYFSDWDGATDATDRWVDGVASTGFFRCPAGLANEIGVDKIPTGWTKLDL